MVATRTKNNVQNFVEKFFNIFQAAADAAAAADATLVQYFVENIFPKVVLFFQKYAILLVEIVQRDKT